jgi:hypothetical protein
MPPQVLIHVLVAEVTINDDQEIGVEFGLQSPVLFNRSIATGTSVINNGVPTPQIGVPGFSFPSFSGGPSPLPNSTNVNPAVVGFQGLNSLGVNRVSPNVAGVGGLIFSASSNSFSLLLRALKTQGRLDVLSAPKVMTLDNQTAAVNIGQDFPVLSSSTISPNVGSTQNIERRNVGVLLRVTPRVTPEGKVLLRVFPEVSSVGQLVALGNGIVANAFNIQQVETTVVAQDGETVILGGMIQQRDTKQENKIPCLGDLPYVGAAFRYRTQVRSKTELLIVLTPYVIRSQADADRMTAEEARKMHWIESDVAKFYGPGGLSALLPNGGAGCGVAGLPAQYPPAAHIPYGPLTPMLNGQIAPLANPPVVPQVPFGALMPTGPGGYPVVPPTGMPLPMPAPGAAPGGVPGGMPGGPGAQPQPNQVPAAGPAGPALTPAAFNYPPQAQPQQQLQQQPQGQAPVSFPAGGGATYYPPPVQQQPQGQAPAMAPTGGMTYYPPPAQPQQPQGQMPMMTPTGGANYYPPQSQPQQQFQGQVPAMAPTGGMTYYPPQSQPQQQFQGQVPAMAPTGGAAVMPARYNPQPVQPAAMAPTGGMVPAPAGYYYPQPAQMPPQAQPQNPTPQGKDSPKWTLFK